jgi:transposase
LTATTAEYWLQRWRACLPPPADADQRARWLARDLDRYRRLRDDIEAIDLEVMASLADTDGQILTTLPGVASIRAAAFAAHSLPVERFPDAEHLYSATVWPRRSISRRRSIGAAISPVRAWPSTATL